MNLKYYVHELNRKKTKIMHSNMLFTNHMVCNLYNQNNVKVGTLIKQNHHYKINGINYITSLCTVRIPGQGKLIFNLVHESPTDFLVSYIKSVPHYKTGNFENKNIYIQIGPKQNINTRMVEMISPYQSFDILTSST